ncbi:hypothetical protein LX32DRAFT_646840 [Colletotrichum zoysiae]|uniref:Uncharacterized protein n=1 Tax=Colletotrichum zoysiae TaxID=1216348 RepID=A0AAD9H262_9PEZI|nr:hypothetical protein LX32DRAFT_646840 [Colletotrichum zoysiae]
MRRRRQPAEKRDSRPSSTVLLLQLWVEMRGRPVKEAHQGLAHTLLASFSRRTAWSKRGGGARLSDQPPLAWVRILRRSVAYGVGIVAIEGLSLVMAFRVPGQNANRVPRRRYRGPASLSYTGQEGEKLWPQNAPDRSVCGERHETTRAREELN